MATTKTKPDKLLSKDPIMRGLMQNHERPAFGGTPLFIALVRAIISQQISEAAAATIFRRLKQLTELTPTAVLELSPESIRSCGISMSKVGYIRSISHAVLAGHLDEIETMPDEEAIKTLVQLKGVGRWTAEMILIFALGRDNVWPCDDAGLRRTVKQLYGYETLEEFKSLGDRFAPYRSHAAWYLWCSLDVKQ